MRRYYSRFAQACVWLGRRMAYPFHALFRVGSRLLVLAATVAPILLPALLASVVWIIRDVSVWLVINRFLANAAGNATLLQFATFFASLGIAGTLLKNFGSAALGEIKTLWNLMLERAKGNWFPSLDVVDSIETTWREYTVSIPRTLCDSLSSFTKLMFILIAVVLVVGATWLGQKRATSESTASPKSKDVHHVVVTPAHGMKSDTLRVYLRQNSVFSLMHMDNAKLSTPNSGLGICLDSWQIEWLDGFKAAMNKCMEKTDWEDLNCGNGEKPCPVLKVTGFASVAPEQGGTSNSSDQDSGKTFNCKVANLRARAVGAYLADDGDKSHWECPVKDAHFNGADNSSVEHCTGADQHLSMTRKEVGSSESHSIGIVVEQWASECQMRRGKPANDGAVPDPRRYRVEVLNRAVHIQVLQDFCSVRESAT